MFSHTWPESFGETLLEAIYIGQAPQRMIILLLLFILFELTQVSSGCGKEDLYLLVLVRVVKIG
jgi:hypothetical protein